MFDELAQHNRERWTELVQANVPYSRPWLDLDKDKAAREVDPKGIIGNVDGKDVLCLAGGGGQQSAAFALLGARVTVLDFCEAQLERDQETARHYGVEVRTVVGDMRDLSCFAAGTFDVVWHAHSLNFIPDCGRVFDQVARVLRPGGIYRLECWNPLAHSFQETTWDGKGYPLFQPYVDGAEVLLEDPYWDLDGPEDTKIRIRGPREFRHSLGSILNGLIRRGFLLVSVWEEITEAPDAKPGTFPHLNTMAPPWLNVYGVLSPDLVDGRARTS